METTLIISADSKNNRLNLKKVWQFRSLLFSFTKRDIQVLYAQTKLGIVWSFIQAITAGFIIFFFFGHLIKVPIPNNIPYIIYAYPGMMAWYYFAKIISLSGTSLVEAQQIIKKVYFPKLILPISKSLVGLIDFIVWFIVYIGILLIYRHPLSIFVVLLPIAIVLNIITGLSIAIWLSALTVKYRDFHHIIPYLIGYGIFVTPVFFPSAMIPQQYHFLIFLNPMAGSIAFMRWCLLDSEFSLLSYSLGIIPVVVLFISGLYYFRKVEGKMADLL